MFDDEFGQDFTEEHGSSGALDLANFGDFTSDEKQVVETDGLPAGEMSLSTFGNSGPGRLNELLEAIDNADPPDMPVVQVPMDMITQYYHQF